MLCIPFDFETPFTWQSKKIRSWYFQCIEGQSLLILRITNFPCKSKKSIVTIKASEHITEKTFIITIIMVHKILNDFKWPLKWLKRIGLKRLNSTPLQYKVVPKINFWRSKSKFNSCDEQFTAEPKVLIEFALLWIYFFLSMYDEIWASFLF